MKKIKMIFMSAASLAGIVAASAFSGPNQAGGWKGGVHYIKGTDPGQYTCVAPLTNTCTYVSKNSTIRFDTGVFTLH